jgi:hypothetical protein
MKNEKRKMKKGFIYAPLGGVFFIYTLRVCVVGFARWQN